MKRPVPLRSRLVAGYTLIEILVATTLSLVLLGSVVFMFGRVGEAITNSRSTLEMADRLRLAAQRLQLDLAGVTVTMRPPRDPANNEGYFEYIEGPVMTGTVAGMTHPSDVAFNTDVTSTPSDTTVGDFDDILMFTTRSTGRPFVGKFNGSSAIESDVAEVAWFLRGRTLYRRVLLVAPSAALPTGATARQSYCNNYDVSARWDSTATKMVANTLSDLTRRECRYAHDKGGTAFPYDVRSLWCWTLAKGGTTYYFPTLPTLRECCNDGWGGSLTSPANPFTAIDFWTNKSGYRLADNALSGGAAGTRVADDVILTNVIGFDVKAWDPGAAAYVDLGYNPSGTATRFNDCGDSNSSLRADDNLHARVYDTYSTSHFDVTWSNGIDDDSNGVVDDATASELGTNKSPPYPYPLRAVQIKIRVFEPDSKQIREVTVVQDFLPQ